MALNRRGGVLLLDAVPEQTPDRLVGREAAQALMVAAHKPKPK